MGASPTGRVGSQTTVVDCLCWCCSVSLVAVSLVVVGVGVVLFGVLLVGLPFGRFANPPC